MSEEESVRVCERRHGRQRVSKIESECVSGRAKEVEERDRAREVMCESVKERGV